MASRFFPLHSAITALFFFLAFPLSNGEDAQYSACSFLYSCGKIQNVGYPFWGGNRPGFCGIPNFKLSCKEDDQGQNYTKMNIYGNEIKGLSVLDINTSSHTMVVSQEKLLQLCHLEDSSNITLISALKPEAGYTNISLFYGCLNCDSKYNTKSFTCSNPYDVTKGTAYYFDNLSDIRRINKSCSCKNNVTFLFNTRGFDELSSTTNALFQSVLMKWPNISMEYTVNFTACSKCVESGGRCGSPENPSSDQFVCHCREGSHQPVCSQSGDMLPN